MANMEYLNQYEKENIRQIRLKINRKTEPELLEWVEKQENIQGYIKRIIRQDMKIEGKKLVICKECDRRGTYDCPVHIGCATDGDDEPDKWFCGDGEERKEDDTNGDY